MKHVLFAVLLLTFGAVVSQSAIARPLAAVSALPGSVIQVIDPATETMQLTGLSAAGCNGISVHLPRSQHSEHSCANCGILAAFVPDAGHMDPKIPSVLPMVRLSSVMASDILKPPRL